MSSHNSSLSPNNVRLTHSDPTVVRQFLVVISIPTAHTAQVDQSSAEGEQSELLSAIRATHSSTNHYCDLNFNSDTGSNVPRQLLEITVVSE